MDLVMDMKQEEMPIPLNSKYCLNGRKDLAVEKVSLKVFEE